MIVCKNIVTNFVYISYMETHQYTKNLGLIWETQQSIYTLKYFYNNVFTTNISYQRCIPTFVIWSFFHYQNLKNGKVIGMETEENFIRFFISSNELLLQLYIYVDIITSYIIFFLIKIDIYC